MKSIDYPYLLMSAHMEFMKHKWINSNIEHLKFKVFALFYILTSVTLLSEIVTGGIENNRNIKLAWAEEINGTENSDNITGTLNQDTIRGFGGNDTLDGKEAGDDISGGNGDDMI